MAVREEKKQKTRSALLDAALAVMSRGGGFGALGLRELTREAGVVPTAFYRHFKDMDELGLALVELQRAGEAVPILERAQALREKHGAPAAKLGDVHFALAKALWSKGRGATRARALELADRALGDYAKAGQGATRDRSEVERWLTRARS